MSFIIKDTRKTKVPKIRELIEKGIISPDEVGDWLRTIYEIRFFEEKVKVKTLTWSATAEWQCGH